MSKIPKYNFDKCDKPQKKMLHGICLMKQALGCKCTIDQKICSAKPSNDK